MSAPIREIRLDVGGVSISGLLSEPSDATGVRALVVALHGLGMHAGYFHGTAAPGLSLLELGARLGFVVWAPDRPGVGSSSDLPDAEVTLYSQARLVLDAIDVFASRYAPTAGVFLVGHSYGTKLVLAMAAESRGRELLGLDLSSCGLHYAFDWSAARSSIERRARPGEAGSSWGPAALYPPGTFSREVLPLHPNRDAQVEEGGRWTDDFVNFAPEVQVPVRMTFAEHERLWRTDDQELSEIRALLSETPRLVVDIQASAGHNISLGWTARAYHLKALAFAEECIAMRLQSASPRDRRESRKPYRNL